MDADSDRKAWSTYQARAALAGFQLWRTDPADGVQRLFLGRWGVVRVIADFDELDRLLDQLLGNR